MKQNKLIILFLVGSMAFTTSCTTGIFGTNEVPVTENQPQAPPPPVVIDGVRTSYADVVERSSPAVVRIEAEIKRQPVAKSSEGPVSPEDFFRQFPMPQQEQRSPTERGVGSGVLVSADGTLLTNAHVIDGADKITVFTSDNKTFQAKLVGIDKPSDLAVLKIESQNLPFVALGNSDTVRVGDIVLAIGNPLGIGQTVTAGIISAKGRRTGLSYGGGDSYEDFLQTDAPINRGNSGGALVNLNGELIGINSQILSTTGGSIGIGFSIPSNMAKSVMEQLLANGRVRRGLLGVNIQDITGDIAQALDLQATAGVIVNRVQSGGAAEKAGVQVGDIITAINSEKIEDGNVLRNKIAGTLPGTEITISLLRKGETLEIKATVGEFELEQAANTSADSPTETSENTKSGKLGLTLQPLTPAMAKQLGVAESTEGLAIIDVSPNSVAAEAGITKGDVLLEVNRIKVATAENVEAEVAKSGNKPVLLLISRKGQTLFLALRVQ